MNIHFAEYEVDARAKQLRAEATQFRTACADLRRAASHRSSTGRGRTSAWFDVLRRAVSPYGR